MGDPSNQGHEALRARARERIEQQLLPRTKPARTWGGRGTGLPCSLCDAPIRDSEPEMELEYDSASAISVVRFHLQCQAVWETERQAVTPSEWIPIERELPPLHTIVEVRLSLGESRVIILNVMRVCDGETGPVVWLNATTNSQLPENWRPIEWRAPPGHAAAPASALQHLATTRRA